MFDRPLAQVPFLAIDVETTGVDRRTDRIVEIAAVAMAPGQRPRVVLDTLVDPRRPLGATEVHGITPDMVVGAPIFADLVPALRAALANRVLVAHNGAFDLGFLRSALWRCGWDDPVPWLCTMRGPRALGASGRWPLWFACSRAGFQLADAHCARADAFATAHLFRHQLAQCEREGIPTLAGWVARARAVGMQDAWLDTVEAPAWPAPPLLLTSTGARLKPRRARAPARDQTPSERYLTAVVQVVSNLRLANDVLSRLATMRDELGLDRAELDRIYDVIYRGAYLRYAEDGRVDAIEQAHLDRLNFCLQFLGWSARGR